jgi:type IV pilus assembly protein PilY1
MPMTRKVVRLATVSVQGKRKVTFTKSVNAEADDGRWAEGNSTINTTGQLLMGYDSGTTKQTNTFVRFTNVTIPKGATILSAKLTMLSAYTTSAATVKVKINAVKAANPTAPATYSAAEDATRTTASVAWDGVAATTDGVWFDTPDFAAVVQELVNQATWASGNALLIYLEDNGSTATNYTLRKTYMYGGTGADKLTIEYK